MSRRSYGRGSTIFGSGAGGVKRLIYIYMVLCAALMCGCKIQIDVRPNTFYWAREYRNKESGREVIFWPMVHVGDSAYFGRVRDFLDDRRGAGYTIYNEELDIRAGCESCFDTLMRKFRRVTGFAFSLDDPESYVNEDSRPGDVSQSSVRIGTQHDRVVDMTLVDLVAQYEAEHGEIGLREYDWSVPIGEKYSEDSTAGHSLGDMLRKYRDAHLTSVYLADTASRVVIVYGLAHMEPVAAILEQNGYRRNWLWSAFWYRK